MSRPRDELGRDPGRPTVRPSSGAGACPSIGTGGTGGSPASAVDGRSPAGERATSATRRTDRDPIGFVPGSGEGRNGDEGRTGEVPRPVRGIGRSGGYISTQNGKRSPRPVSINLIRSGCGNWGGLLNLSAGLCLTMGNPIFPGDDTQWPCSIRPGLPRIPAALARRYSIGSGCSGLDLSRCLASGSPDLPDPRLDSRLLGVLLGKLFLGQGCAQGHASCCRGSSLVPAPRRHPLRVGAVLELGIGRHRAGGTSTACCYVEQVYVSAPRGTGRPKHHAVRGVVAAFCPLPPTPPRRGDAAGHRAMGRERARGGAVGARVLPPAATSPGPSSACLLAGFYLLPRRSARPRPLVGAPRDQHGRGRDRPRAGGRGARCEPTAIPEAAAVEETLRSADGPCTWRSRLSGMSAFAQGGEWSGRGCSTAMLPARTVCAFSLILAVFLAEPAWDRRSAAWVRSWRRRLVVVGEGDALGVCQLASTAAIAWMRRR